MRGRREWGIEERSEDVKVQRYRKRGRRMNDRKTGKRNKDKGERMKEMEVKEKKRWKIERQEEDRKRGER